MTNAQLGRLIRTKKATPEQVAEMERRLEERPKPGPVYRTIWDLPVARVLFEADQRDAR